MHCAAGSQPDALLLSQQEPASRSLPAREIHGLNEQSANLPRLVPSRRLALALLSTEEVGGGGVTCEACRNIQMCMLVAGQHPTCSWLSGSKPSLLVHWMGWLQLLMFCLTCPCLALRAKQRQRGAVHRSPKKACKCSGRQTQGAHSPPGRACTFSATCSPQVPQCGWRVQRCQRPAAAGFCRGRAAAPSSAGAAAAVHCCQRWPPRPLKSWRHGWPRPARP